MPPALPPAVSPQAEAQRLGIKKADVPLGTGFLLEEFLFGSDPFVHQPPYFA